MLSLSTHLFVKKILFVRLHFVWFTINQSFLKRNEKKCMLTSQILQHCLRQQLRRNWTSYQKTKPWKLLHGETTTPSNIYHIDSCKMETWWEVHRNNNETVMFEWDLWVFSHNSDRRSKLETAHPTQLHSSTWSN